MSTLRKTIATALVTLAGAAGLLVAASSVGALAQGDAVHSDVSVLADSPWGNPKP